MIETFDAIVIGGSVAGAPTAMLLARHGHHVLLIEKNVFPRDTNSTHFIWPRGVSYLNRWGLAETILKSTPSFNRLEINIEGISLIGAVPMADLKQRFKLLHGDERGVMDLYCGPRRYFLDNYLLDCAKEAGVFVREAACYMQPIIENNRVIGIIAKRHDGSLFSANAKIIIAADGRFSRFAKDIGAQYTDYRGLSTFAYYSYFANIEREALAIHKRGRFGTAIFPTLNQTHMVLVYGPTKLWPNFKNNPEKNFFDIFHFCAPEVARLIVKAKRTEKFKGCGHMQAFQRQLHGPGWVLIGDASSFKDQVTAMGITHAFRDAELLASFVHKSLSNEITVDFALNQYRTLRAKDYIDYFDLVCKTAEMNPYTQKELQYFYSIKTDQKRIDQLISQFADTLPLSARQTTLDPSILFPEFIQNYNPNIYPQSFPMRI